MHPTARAIQSLNLEFLVDCLAFKNTPDSVAELVVIGWAKQVQNGLSLDLPQAVCGDQLKAGRVHVDEPTLAVDALDAFCNGTDDGAQT